MQEVLDRSFGEEGKCARARKAEQRKDIGVHLGRSRKGASWQRDGGSRNKQGRTWRMRAERKARCDGSKRKANARKDKAYVG